MEVGRRVVVMVPEGKEGDGCRFLAGLFQEVVDHLGRVKVGKTGNFFLDMRG